MAQNEDINTVQKRLISAELVGELMKPIAIGVIGLLIIVSFLTWFFSEQLGIKLAVLSTSLSISALLLINHLHDWRMSASRRLRALRVFLPLSVIGWLVYGGLFINEETFDSNLESIKSARSQNELAVFALDNFDTFLRSWSLVRRDQLERINRLQEAFSELEQKNSKKLASILEERTSAQNELDEELRLLESQLENSLTVMDSELRSQASALAKQELEKTLQVYSNLQASEERAIEFSRRQIVELEGSVGSVESMNEEILAQIEQDKLTDIELLEQQLGPDKRFSNADDPQYTSERQEILKKYELLKRDSSDLASKQHAEAVAGIKVEVSKLEDSILEKTNAIKIMVSKAEEVAQNRFDEIFNQELERIDSTLNEEREKFAELRMSKIETLNAEFSDRTTAIEVSIKEASESLAAHVLEFETNEVRFLDGVSLREKLLQDVERTAVDLRRLQSADGVPVQVIYALLIKSLCLGGLGALVTLLVAPRYSGEDEWRYIEKFVALLIVGPLMAVAGYAILATGLLNAFNSGGQQTITGSPDTFKQILVCFVIGAFAELVYNRLKIEVENRSFTSNKEDTN